MICTPHTSRRGKSSLKNRIPRVSNQQKKIRRVCLCWGWPTELKINKISKLHPSRVHQLFVCSGTAALPLTCKEACWTHLPLSTNLFWWWVFSNLLILGWESDLCIIDMEAAAAAFLSWCAVCKTRRSVIWVNSAWTGPTGSSDQRHTMTLGTAVEIFSSRNCLHTLQLHSYTSTKTKKTKNQRAVTHTHRHQCTCTFVTFSMMTAEEESREGAPSTSLSCF